MPHRAPRLPARRPRRTGRACRLLLVGLLAVVASACQVRVGTDVSVAADGSGRLALTVALDEELASSLGADGFDPFAGLDALPDGWTVDREGDRQVTVAADFADPAGLATRVEQLARGTDAEDPLLLEDVTVDVDDAGNGTFAGMAGFRPPGSTGLRGTGVTFDGDDLASLLADDDQQVLRVDLRVTMPGPVVETNADEVDGATATWSLPVTELVEVSAVSEPGSDRTLWLVLGAFAVGLVLGLLVLRLVRR